MPEYQDPPARNALLELRNRIERLEQEVVRQRSARGLVSLSRGEHMDVPDPREGQVMVHYDTNKVWYYAEGQWRPLGGGNAIYAIEVFEYDEPVVAGDGAFGWEIPEDLDGSTLIKCEAYVNVAGGGSMQVQFHNETQGVDMLSTKVSVDAGELNSKDAATPAVVSNGDVAWGDHIRVDVDSASGTGMGVILFFAPASTASTVIQGSQGEPGGVTRWLGAWASGTNYSTSDSVSHLGTSYVARAASLAVEPGVTAGWETYWQVLSLAKTASGITMILNGNGLVLDPGRKAYVVVPFDCTISEVVMLADQIGNAVVDIWKTTYAGFPPLDANSITSGTPPTISSSRQSVDNVLSGWSKTLVAGDTLVFNLDSCSLITLLVISINVLR